jgi:hypothetical protein
MGFIVPGGNGGFAFQAIVGIGGGYCPIGCAGGIGIDGTGGLGKKTALKFTLSKLSISLTVDSGAMVGELSSAPSAADLAVVQRKSVSEPIDVLDYRRSSTADLLVEPAREAELALPEVELLRVLPSSSCTLHQS